MKSIKITFLDVNTTSTAPNFPENRIGKLFVTKDGGKYTCDKVTVMDDGTQVYTTKGGHYVLSTEIRCWEVWNSNNK